MTPHATPSLVDCFVNYHTLLVMGATYGLMQVIKDLFGRQSWFPYVSRFIPIALSSALIWVPIISTPILDTGSRILMGIVLGPLTSVVWDYATKTVFRNQLGYRHQAPMPYEQPRDHHPEAPSLPGDAP